MRTGGKFETKKKYTCMYVYYAPESKRFVYYFGSVRKFFAARLMWRCLKLWDITPFYLLNCSCVVGIMVWLRLVWTLFLFYFDFIKFQVFNYLDQSECLHSLYLFYHSILSFCFAFSSLLCYQWLPLLFYSWHSVKS